MLNFVSDCVVLAGKAWFGSLVILTITLTVLVLAAVTTGVIKIFKEGRDE